MIRLAMAQINPTVGDLEGNSNKILKFIKKAKDFDADLVIFPELALTGYPPEDLLLKPQFIEANIKQINQIAGQVTGITAIIGFVDKPACAPRAGKKDAIYNAAAVIHSKEIAVIYHKMFLPNYGVFDEERYFSAGETPINIILGGIPIGIGICEDIWYPEGPAKTQSLAGAQVIININASPYHVGKVHLRKEIISTRATDNIVIVAYNNMVGGQDELVFDGHSMIVNEAGELLVSGEAFAEDLIITDLDVGAVSRKRLEDPRWLTCLRAARRQVKKNHTNLPAHKVQAGTNVKVVALDLKKTKTCSSAARRQGGKRPFPSKSIDTLKPTCLRAAHKQVEEIYRALVLGTRDYVLKNGFKHVVIGISGGIDSALVAAIAVDALGKENVTGVFMPSPYSSETSRKDGLSLAKNLDIELRVISIKETFESYLNLLKDAFKGLNADATEENIQARIRGNILMALSNKFGWLVLTTGNKSEMSVGYATLYGDMAGGFAVIKDLPKMMVYDISKYINSLSRTELIPASVLTKAPTAELRHDQKDQDTLPPYDVLDAILKAYIEEDLGFQEILAMGFDRETVRRVIKMVDSSEYKRRQAPPGIKITPRALGKDRRMPITNRHRSF